jgi:RNA polymerase sigma-70 factor (ECF subfamily)
MNDKANTQANNLKFNDVYNEFRPLIATFLRTKVKNEQAQEEIICDVFIKVNEHLKAYNPEKAKLNTWIYTIVNRKVIDYYRSDEGKRASHYVCASDLATDEGENSFDFAGETSSASQIENKELKRKIRRAIRNLKPIEKRVAILRLVKEMEYNEIADILEIPLNSVKATIFRAKESLQIALRAEYALLG